MYKFLYLILLLILALPIWASEKLIIEPDQGRQPIIEAIQGAKNTVDLAMYGFTDPDLMQSFIQAKQQGKSVRILLQHFPYNNLDENLPAIQQFSDHQVNLVYAPSTFYLLHQKTLVLDHQQALILTFNFTRSTFTKQRNFGLIIDDPVAVQEIQQVFNADWQNKTIIPKVSRLVWSPDNSRAKILSFIHNAKKEIKIYAQGLSDYQVIDALVGAVKRGVSVQVLTSGPWPGKKWDYLKKAGVQIVLDKKLIIHAKVILVDQKKAFLGSINFTQASIDKNRELATMVQDPKIVTKLLEVFKRDWKEAG